MHSRRKRFSSLAILLIVLAAIFARNAGRLLVVDAPEVSDVILVLAGDTEFRPALAVQLLDRGYGREVLLDVPASAKVFGSTESELAEKFARDLGRADSIRVCPIEGLSTRDESHDAEKCLAGEKGQRVLLVTSDFHTRRALTIFRHEVKGKTFSVAAAHSEAQFGERWWTHREWAKTCFEEWLKVFWWNAIDRWR